MPIERSFSIPSGLAVEESVCGVRRHVATARANGRAIGFVPTMGALHAGHASLIEAARDRCGSVVVSIFVNPTQFGPGEDFQRYPRTIDADLAACREAGADIVFLPSKDEIYPEGFSTFVEVAGLSDVFEGAIRPGHFRGVATVVLKLLNIVTPDVAYFGAKDYQQQLVIRRLVADLDLPVAIETRPTIREPDGLAMSSRNRYLDPVQRQQACALSKSLTTASDRLRSGARDLTPVKAEMRRIIESAGLTTDYTTVCDRRTLRELTEPESRMVLLVAARLGDVRLIDNLEVTLL
ncbi:MAG: pantoate--beta-alanine ligase [Planctomycetaceae bacterium]